MAEKYMNANSMLPLLGMANDYFRQKAKRKIFGDFTNSLKDRFSNVEDPEGLEVQSQQMIKDIYANEYLDPQEQATLLQIGNQFRKTQENRILQQKNDLLASASINALEGSATNSEFYYNDKYINGEELLNVAKQQSGGDPELTEKIYTQLAQKTSVKPKDVIEYDAQTGTAWATTFRVDALGNETIKVPRRAINDSNRGSLTVQGQEELAKAEGKLSMDKLNAQQQINANVASNERIMQRQMAMQDKKTQAELDKQYQKDVTGLYHEVVDPNDPYSTIQAKRKIKEDSKLTPEERRAQYDAGIAKWGFYDQSGKEIEKPQLKTRLSQAPKDVRVKVETEMASQIRNWAEGTDRSKWGMFFIGNDSPLMEWIQKNDRGLYEIIDQGDKEDGNGSKITIEQNLVKAGFVSQERIMRLAKAFNDMSNKDPRDQALLQELELLLGNSLYKRKEIPKKSNGVSGRIMENIGRVK